MQHSRALHRSDHRTCMLVLQEVTGLLYLGLLSTLLLRRTIASRYHPVVYSVQCIDHPVVYNPTRSTPCMRRLLGAAHAQHACASTRHSCFDHAPVYMPQMQL